MTLLNPPASGPPQASGLNECLELANLGEDGKVPAPSRLTSAAALRAAHQQNVRDDDKLATDRARVDAMIDGQPPYNQAALNAQGQGSRANANFLEGKNRIDRANNGYLDIILSVKHLMMIYAEWPDEVSRAEHTRVVEEELTRTIRKWKRWTSSFTRLVDAFNRHGVGVLYFPNPQDFKFSVCGLGDFLIPRQTPACEDDIEIATARKDMTVTELYAMIANPEQAEANGWDVPAVEAAIRRATTASSAFSNTYEIEAAQREVKNGDYIAHRKFLHVPIICAWVREFDGSYSYFMVEKDHEGPFLCQQPHKYKNADEAFILYTYGTGNGTYHGIRGMGHMIYPIIQLLNRSRCSAIDAATNGSLTMLESESANAMENMRIVNVGPYAVLPKGFTAVQNRTMPNLTQTMIPVLSDARNLLDENSSQFYTPSATGVYQNKDDLDSQLQSIAAGASGAVDLFYTSHDRCIREVVRRIIAGPKSDPLVREFHQRVAKRGVPKEFLAAIDHDSTVAYRAIGAGSPAARSLAGRQMLQLLPQLDEIGQRRIIYNLTCDLIGVQNADYVVGKPDQQRLPVDSKIAELENVVLLGGTPVSVGPQEMHAAHVDLHVPALAQTLDGIERGLIDPMQNLPGLKAMLDHVAAHGDALAMNPAQAETYAAVKEAVNNLGQVVTNMERKLRSQQDGQTGGAEQGQPDTQAAIAETKLALEQFKLDLAQRKGELELAAMQAKAAQSLALNDLKQAEAINRKMMFPQTSYAERR